MSKLATLCTGVLLILAVVSGCSDCNRLPALGSGGYNDAAGFNRADSIVSAVGDARDNNQRVLEVIDSLEKTGELSLPKTIFYRTITYNLMGQYRTSLLLYAQLSTIDMSDLATEADLKAYLYSYNNYVRQLCEMRRYDRALREASAADRRLREAGYDGFTDHHDIAQTIGECQLYLGQAGLAAQSFSKALQGVHTRLAIHHDPLDYRECQKSVNAIVKAYYRTRRYAEAASWLGTLDSLYDIAAAHPQRDSVFLDEMKADISYSKALLAHAGGRTAEAERAFSDYLATNTARQLGNVIVSSEYLMLTQRYAEAAHNYEELDHFLKAGGYKADFENFGLYMMPKFRANLLAGQNDSALRVASIVAQYYDSALVRQRRIDADLLTTFYDTEGKERQIAEQNAKLSQQRLFTVVIVMVVFVVFVVFYTMQRRRAYKRLDATNRQLVIASEKAEESSRMKTNFIRQISHEVRTPLNILSGFSQVLAASDIEIDSSELKSISEKIVENSERITHLIDKMLDLSLVSSSTDIACNDTVYPADVANEAIAMSGIRQADHLNLQVEVSPQAQATTIVTNRKSAAKALSLLLGNAVKFTLPSVSNEASGSLQPQGKQDGGQRQRVTLSIGITSEQVAFTVEDTGIGIPPEQAENIFSEFVQLDEFYDGTGIGLTIARSLARHMGGDITLDTTYTAGARFVMSLPLTRIVT